MRTRGDALLIAAVSSIVFFSALGIVIANAPGWERVRNAFFDWEIFVDAAPSIAGKFWVNVGLFLTAEALTAIAQVTLILTGWSIAQFPHLIVPDVDIAASAAPGITLRLLAIALALGALVLLPSLYYLFRVFKGARHPDATPD